MALHHELQIYKAAYDLLGMAFDITQNFPRDFKRSVGEKIRHECTELMVLIFRANVARDAAKIPHQEEILERVQVVELLLRVAKDKQWLAVKKYSEAILVTESVSKQAQGWKKQSANANAAPAA
jgi:hypothetical protein